MGFRVFSASVRRCALAAALISGGGAAAAEPLNVVATTGMVADVARMIGGDRVAVQALMGPGVDPHAYRQTRSDIVALTRADLVLWNGLYLEAQMEELLLDLAEKKPVIAVGEAAPVEARIAHDDYENRFDPHLWMDPARWSHIVKAVRDALIAADADGEKAFAVAADAYLGEMTALDVYTRDVLAGVPDNSRVLVTAHDAFNYFGDAYDFEVLGVQGVSTESEAGLKRIQELVDLLVARKIAAVFVESSVSDRALKALVEGAAAAGHEVRIGGELFSDAMGEDGSYEGTFLGMIDHNVTTISRALGGDAPDRGRVGRLGSGV